MTIPDLRRSVRENRPWKERFNHDAMTDWRVNWRFTMTPTPGGCRISTFGTETTIVVTMPRWVVPTNAPNGTRQIWERYITSLGHHEAGHGALALAAAAEMNKLAHAMGEGANCEDLKSQTDSMARRVIDGCRAKDKAYDEKTRHGASEGAVLPRGGERRER